MFIVVKKAVKYRITGVILRFFDYLCSTKRLNAVPIQNSLSLNTYNYVYHERKSQEIPRKAQL